ncbi:MAG: diguanylate cyclase [Candidatus Firestonebacteria bacterium]
MKISIKVKVVSMVFVIISAVFVMVNIVIIDQLRKPLESEIEKKAVVITRNLIRSSSKSILTGAELRLYEDVENARKSDPRVIYAMVVDKENKIIAHSDTRIVKGTRLKDAASLRAISAGNEFFKQNTADSKSGAGVLDISRAIIISGKKFGVVRLGYSKAEVEKAVSKASRIILAIAGFAIVITIVVSFFGISVMVKPIEQLTKAVKLFGQGGLDHKIPVKSNDEIREFADSFNETVEILDKAQAKLQRSVKDISTLLDASKELNFSQDMKNIASVILYTCKEHINAASSVLYLLLGEEDAILSFNVASGITGTEKISFNTSDPMFKYIAENKRILLMPELEKNLGQSDGKNLDLLKKLKCRALAPVIVKERVSGMMIIGPCKYEREYQEGDWEFLSALIGMANVAVENSYLRTLSITDGLTKSYLRRYFLFRLEEEIKRVQRYGGAISVLMIDLDFFKKINDTYGHQAGDKVLKEFVQVVKSISRSTDLISRYGGEEFVIIATETSRDGAGIYAERIRYAVENRDFDIGNEKIKITLSIGVAGFPADAKTLNELIAKADEMLYQAKESGRNRVCLPKIIEEDKKIT